MNPPNDPRHQRFPAWLKSWEGLFVFGSVGLILAVLFFYAEENARGARNWARAKAAFEADGEIMDPAKFNPPPVAEDKNFAALPYFRVVPDGNTERMQLVVTWKYVLDHLPSGKDYPPPSDHPLPYLGDWQKGEGPPGRDVLVRELIEALHRIDPTAKIPPDATPVDLFQLICAAPAELRTLNATHPFSRLETDYSTLHPWNFNYGCVVAYIQIAKLLNYDARLALLSDQPEVALEDLQVSWKMDAPLRNEPLLISGLISLGCIAISLSPLDEGLSSHRWSDPQLATIDADLREIDLLREEQQCIRGELVIFTLPTIDYFSTHRRRWIMGIQAMDSETGTNLPLQSLALELAADFVPRGWFDDWKAGGARKELIRAHIVDPVARRVYPERGTSVALLKEETVSHWMALLTSSGSMTEKLAAKFAYQQAQVDEARIASRLERYRLAHGVYPDKLDDLVPAFGPDLPRDIMNGEPYHYRLNADQTYLLYSVGWNQKDDHGEAGRFRSQDSPDWIWTNYPNMK